MIPQAECRGLHIVDRLRVGLLNGFLSGRGTTRAEDAQGTPTQSHISPSILVYEDYTLRTTIIPSPATNHIPNRPEILPPTDKRFPLSAPGVWGTSSYEVQDVAGNPWFRLEGKDSQWTGQKKLLLNTGYLPLYPAKFITGGCIYQF